MGDGDDNKVQVKAAQILLSAQGFRCRINGRCEEQTRRCVRELHQKRGLANGGNDEFVLNSPVWENIIVPLKRGNRGTAVRAAQMLLQAKGHRVAIDGIFGPQTEYAVKMFQEQRGYTSVALGTVEHFTWCDLVGEGAYRGDRPSE